VRLIKATSEHLIEGAVAAKAAAIPDTNKNGAAVLALQEGVIRVAGWPAIDVNVLSNLDASN